MSLHRLIYVSDRVAPMTAAQLDDLAAHSSARNHLAGVTGMLLYGGGHFIQLLEGDDGRLRSLYARIAADPRHANVRQLLFKPADGRLFPAWGMNLVNAERPGGLDRERLDRLLLKIRLSRDVTDGTEAVALMSEVQAQMAGEAA